VNLYFDFGVNKS